MLKTRLFERFVDSGEMTQRALCERLGMTETHLSRIRHGKQEITRSFIDRACLTFGLPADALFFDDDREEAGTVPSARRG